MQYFVLYYQLCPTFGEQKIAEELCFELFFSLILLYILRGKKCM